MATFALLPRIGGLEGERSIAIFESRTSSLVLVNEEVTRERDVDRVFICIIIVTTTTVADGNAIKIRSRDIFPQKVSRRS